MMIPRTTLKLCRGILRTSRINYKCHTPSKYGVSLEMELDTDVAVSVSIYFTDVSSTLDFVTCYHATLSARLPVDIIVFYCTILLKPFQTLY